ncbi:hypothetical protein AT1219_70095 [Vibrio alginolyticus]
MSTLPVTKHILPVFIFDLSVKFVTPPKLGGVFLSIKNLIRISGSNITLLLFFRINYRYINTKCMALR